jgi:hypothetical protein
MITPILTGEVTAGQWDPQLLQWNATQPMNG